MQNSDFWSRITGLYGSQTWPVILCMYNHVLSIRINSLYGSQPSSVVYACKTATFGSNLQVSKGTRPLLSFCAGNTACPASESLVSMGPSPHVRCLDAKQPLLDTNNKSLWVPDITCLLCMRYSVISTRITCLYGSQHLSVVLHEKTATFGAELQVSMGPRHDVSFFAWKRAWLAPELIVSMGPSPHVRFFDAKPRLMD